MEKRVSESRTEQVQILTQREMNGYGRLFGGQQMVWIDIVAAVTARRHCGMNVTTAMVDSLEFGAPAYANDTIVLVGTVVYTGTTSMEVCVKTYIERGGFELQINVVDKETLEKARENPEEYRDLVVRIGGYSDYFVNLEEGLQDNVIARTGYGR